MSLKKYIGQVGIYENKNDRGTFYKIQKDYKDKNGDWKTSDFFNSNDLLAIAEIIKSMSLVSTHEFEKKEPKRETHNPIRDEDIPF